MNPQSTTNGSDSNASEASGQVDPRLTALAEAAEQAAAHPFVPGPVRQLVPVLVGLLIEQQARIDALASQYAVAEKVGMQLLQHAEQAAPKWLEGMSLKGLSLTPCEDCGNRQGAPLTDIHGEV
jgi:hypothetical protein